MKRTLPILSFAGLLCLCLIALTPSASAAEVVDSGYCGGEGDGTNLTWTLTDDGTLTIEGEGEMEEGAFTNNQQIQTAVLLDGITSVSHYAFYGCGNLTSVFLPESLTSIGGYAFYSCQSLISITIPPNVSFIGSEVFSYCYGLELIFAQGDALAEAKRIFPQVPLIYPQSVRAWTESFGAIPHIWDETISSSSVLLDLTNGKIFLYEQDGLTFCVQSGIVQATTSGVLVRSDSNTENNITVVGGNCELSISDLNISSTAPAIDIVTGASLSLTLVGSNSLNSTYSGIHVPSKSILVVAGSGELSVTGRLGAGIGGGDDAPGDSLDNSCGTIIINSGNISATATGSGAGIGSTASYYSDPGGSITINGGTVTATGGYGAGIGGGENGSGGIITINSGIVTAYGGARGAGIGGGENGSGGIITINGGTVKAYGRENSSFQSNGIGSGNYGKGGTITINGGSVIASGGAYQNIIESDIGAGKSGAFDAVTISDQATVTNADGEAPYVVETIFIDTQPMTTTAHVDKIPFLSVAAHNHSGISHQWQVYSDNSYWSNLEGQTSAQTTFPMSAELNGKYVRCQLTNGWGNILYTDAVQVWTLAFAQQPVSVEANLNDLVAFNAASTCSNVTYQWQRSYDDGQSWVDVPGETFSTLAVNATLSESSAKYRCVITATNGDQLASDVVEIKLDAGALVTYTARYYQQNPDGQGYTLVNQQVLEGISGQTVTIPETSYEGFTENTQAGTLTGTVTGDSGLILARYYDRNTYEITFRMNGGSVLPPLEARYGADITAPSNPSRFAYTFAGWYADEALTEEYTFTTMPLGGATVYAKWVPVGADRGIEYQINGLAVRDISTFEFLDGIPDGKFLVEVSVTNLKATGTDTILLVQYTDQGQMLGMQYLYASTQAGQTVTFGASVDNTDGKIGKIKAMILPSLGSPVPLANAVEFM